MSKGSHVATGLISGLVGAAGAAATVIEGPAIVSAVTGWGLWGGLATIGGTITAVTTAPAWIPVAAVLGGAAVLGAVGAGLISKITTGHFFPHR